MRKGVSVMNEDIDNIIRFWFGSENIDVIEARDDFWFSTNSQLDQEIKRDFSALVASAYKQDLANWAETAKGSLALLVLLDQFTRNIYRGTGRAFAYDEQTRAICLQGIERGFDLELSSSERVFYYLPLEHSELMSDQKQCVQLFKRLAHNVDEKYAGKYQQRFNAYVEYAVLHYKIIDDFGRFPHRNDLLGRESTQAELKYLIEGGATFGQASN